LQPQAVTSMSLSQVPLAGGPDPGRWQCAPLPSSQSGFKFRLGVWHASEGHGPDTLSPERLTPPPLKLPITVQVFNALTEMPVVLVQTIDELRSESLSARNVSLTEESIHEQRKVIF
jgi:hypothetical protein